ncbi:uncharacterized protein LOC103577059 isoform X3 [Microplitis demolitor]|uniref:uncharacterized protein LOC103577059 isoform X3 n=1 Tax=Microplitis demolitor TaxID=69319 RepID=UPI00235B6C21|nr:uncharacterized protein LOC103577059 isoform X3 [Microplitis demolitor]
MKSSVKGDQLDSNESECNSMVPDKCRCQNNSSECYCWCKSSSTALIKDNNRWSALPRSLSRSSTSSCSSSLVQFENNERACAAVSPSGYSYDSLEYSNCSNSYFDNTSPDSLEDSENENYNPSKKFQSSNDNVQFYSKIRPYKSFESLDTCDNSQFVDVNSFKQPKFKRDVWEERYSEEKDYYRSTLDNDNNYHHQASMEWTSTMDLREIGLESDAREAVLLNLTRSQLGSFSDSPYAKLNIDHSNNQPSRIMPVEQRGWSNSMSSDFNFRFTNKSRSVPSLPTDLDGLSTDYLTRNLYCNDIYDTSSNTGLSSLKYSENFTRVNSVPVNLNLFGSVDTDSEPLSITYDSMNAEDNYREMADYQPTEMPHYQLNKIISNDNGDSDIIAADKAIAPAPAIECEPDDEINNCLDNSSSSSSSSITSKPVIDESNNVVKKKTVKIQDRGFDVLTIENNIDAVVDEAIRQLGSKVEEITNYKDMEQVMDSIPRTPSTKDRARRVKNNASYELAQQWEIDEKVFKNSPSSASGYSSPNTRKRILNNASYELAQQSDYIKALHLTSKPFQRMDACDELNESGFADDKSQSIKSEHNYFENRGGNSSAGDRNQSDNLFSQIKKNSVCFSIYGETGNCIPDDVGPIVDDEVDFSYLETKVIANEPVIREFEYLLAVENDKKINNKNEEEEKEEIDINSCNYNDNNNSNNDDIEIKNNSEDLELNEFCISNEMALLVDNSNLKVNGAGMCGGIFAEDNRQNPQRRDRAIEEEEKLPMVLVEESIVKKTKLEVGESNQQEKQEQEQDEHKQQWIGEPKPTQQNVVNSTSVVCNHGLASASNTRSGNSIVGRDLDECGTESEGKKEEVIYEGSDNQPWSKPMLVMLTKSLENVRTDSSTPATTTTASTATSRQPTAMVTVPPASDATISEDDKNKKSRLGGFLQRFSKFRFSGRSKSPRLDSSKKNKVITDTRSCGTQSANVGKRVAEHNYIIIPLHAPEEETNNHEKRHHQQQLEILNNTGVADNPQLDASSIGTNGRPPVCMSKPPLPPLQNIRACASTTIRSTSSPEPTSTRRRAITDLGNPAIIKMAKARAMQQQQQPHHHQHHNSNNHQHHQSASQMKDHPGGLLETDLDADIKDGDINNSSIINDGASTTDKKTRSLLNLTTHTSRQGRENVLLRVPQSPAGFSCDGNTSDHPDYDVTGEHINNNRPHKSMEFLLDKENLDFIKPPENELQKGMAAERVPSEHELRVQRSLQRLNVPDWYKNSPAARDGFRLKRHSDASQHSGWRSLGSKTTSLSSLSSSSNLRQPSRGLLSSPTPQPVFSRWSTSLLNSAGSSPASSIGSSFNYRQPYLGWRSQERLTNPRTPAERLAQGILPQLESKHQQQEHHSHQQQQQQRNNQQLDVRNSIKEVTSAIVHYVQSGQEGTKGGRLSPRFNDDNNDDRSDVNYHHRNYEERFASPRGEGIKMCWMESSFVGTRPVDSPETPVSLTADKECSCTGCDATGTTKSCSCVESTTNSGLYLDLAASDASNCPSPSSSYHRDASQQRYSHHRESMDEDMKEAKAAAMTAAFFRNKPSPGSTTLEDVLDSLLGLPSASSRTPSPGGKPGKSCSDLRQDLQESAKQDATESTEKPIINNERSRDRRKSEGSDIVPLSHRNLSSSRNRRVSFDNTATVDKYLVKCRHNKCNNTTTLVEARRVYKSCHYCMYLYCSRECRRAHWQRHRKTCLHSRVGAICRQVLSSAKDDLATLKHISLLARHGYTAHGRGAVKFFFKSPELADKFIANGFKDLGEPTYVRSSDLLLSEMGTELYAEVMRLCKSYNPETRLVLYVAVCVVNEVPSTDVGGVRWERQLISRCGKIRLDAKPHHHHHHHHHHQQQQQHHHHHQQQQQQQHRHQQQQQQQQHQQHQQQRQENVVKESLSSSPACNITREMESPETLVLTSLPQSNNKGEKESTPKKIREIGFGNIQRQLRLRGVSLRRHFPQVYKKLCSYVDGSVDKFAPVTIYPIDQASGKSFMCIIMLDAEPERLRLLPTDSSRVKTIDISAIEQE